MHMSVRTLGSNIYGDMIIEFIFNVIKPIILYSYIVVMTKYLPTYFTLTVVFTFRASRRASAPWSPILMSYNLNSKPTKDM